MLALLSACSHPWTDVARRERPWWEDASRLEEVEGLELVELPSGEPVGYWPRVVIRRDRVDLDARAWFLSLDPEVLRAPEAAEALVDETVWTFAAAEPTGAIEPIAPLKDRLDGLREAMARLGGETDALVIVPDASVRAETVARVAYTAAQGGFGSYTLAGAAEGRVRAAWASEGGCAAAVTIEPAVIVASSGLRLVGPGGTCPGTPADLVGVVDALVAACAPAWSEVQGDRRCLDATVVAHADARTLLGTLGALHATDGRVHTAGLALRPAEEAVGCEGAVPVDGLSPEVLGEVCRQAPLPRLGGGQRASGADPELRALVERMWQLQQAKEP